MNTTTKNSNSPATLADEQPVTAAKLTSSTDTSNGMMKLTLRTIAEKIVGEDEASNYLKFELPKEDPSREFELIAEDSEVEIYRDSDVYLLHCSTGLETGMWDDLATDYPAVAPLLAPSPDAQPVTAAMTEWEIALAGNKLQAERDALFVHLARLAEFQKLRARNPKSKALLRFPEFIADEVQPVTVLFDVWHGDLNKSIVGIGETVLEAMADLLRQPLGVGYAIAPTSYLFAGLVDELQRTGRVSFGWGSYTLAAQEAAE